MKRFIIKLFTLVLFLQLYGCYQCNEKKDVLYHVPIYKTNVEMRQEVTSAAPRSIVNPGRIYFKDSLVYINEKGEGVHVVNNSDPRNPKLIAFINIQGNTDFSIRNYNMFANQGVDMVSLDIYDPSNVVEGARIENAFDNLEEVEEHTSTRNEIYLPTDANKGLLIGYKDSLATVKTPCNN